MINIKSKLNIYLYFDHKSTSLSEVLSSVNKRVLWLTNTGRHDTLKVYSNINTLWSEWRIYEE